MNRSRTLIGSSFTTFKGTRGPHIQKPINVCFSKVATAMAPSYSGAMRGDHSSKTNQYSFLGSCYCYIVRSYSGANSAASPGGLILNSNLIYGKTTHCFFNRCPRKGEDTIYYSQIQVLFFFFFFCENFGRCKSKSGA